MNMMKNSMVTMIIKVLNLRLGLVPHIILSLFLVKLHDQNFDPLQQLLRTRFLAFLLMIR